MKFQVNLNKAQQTPITILKIDGLILIVYIYYYCIVHNFVIAAFFFMSFQGFASFKEITLINRLEPRTSHMTGWLVHQLTKYEKMLNKRVGCLSLTTHMLTTHYEIFHQSPLYYIIEQKFQSFFPFYNFPQHLK